LWDIDFDAEIIDYAIKAKINQLNIELAIPDDFYFLPLLNFKLKGISYE
jgi:hypothetical protein